MIVIINGPLGIGKTQTSWELLAMFPRAAMLDGDYIGAVQPFEIYDDQRVDYLYETITHMAHYHQQHGYPNIVVNYVFETPESLADLRGRLCAIDDVTYAYRLTCSDEEMERRIRVRFSGLTHDPDSLAWELQRFRQLIQIQEINARRGDLGYVIDTTSKTARQVAQAIYDNIHEAVVLVPYDPAWAERFEAERAQVAAALGGRALSIEHIGSTAVPGLSAKPVIDIQVGVRKLADAEDCIEPLAQLGYTFINHPQNTHRRFFRKGSPRTHHLHIVEHDHPEAIDQLVFRDALRADPALVQQYKALKADLAARYRTERAAYTDAKGEFVCAVVADWKNKLQ